MCPYFCRVGADYVVIREGGCFDSLVSTMQIFIVKHVSILCQKDLKNENRQTFSVFSLL